MALFATEKSVTLDTLPAAFAALSASANPRLCIAIDIGGTNTRVAFLDPASGVCYALANEKFNVISQFLAYIAKVDTIAQAAYKGRSVLIATVFAVAGPVMRNGLGVKLTNYQPEDDTLLLDNLPRFLFPHDRTRFINDLEAACHGVIGAKTSGKMDSLFYKLWNGVGDEEQTPDVLANRPYVVVAAGTGLGVGIIVPTSRVGGMSVVVPSEGGHLQITTPSDATAEEKEMLEFIKNDKYAGKFTAEYEDIGSGVGLLNTYKFLTRNKRELYEGIEKPFDVVERAFSASNPDPLAIRAIELSYEYQMFCAQQLAVLTQCAGVLLLGDNQVSNAAFIQQRKDTLKARFLCHQKRSWIEPCSMIVQKISANFNQAGAFKVAVDLMN